MASTVPSRMAVLAVAVGFAGLAVPAQGNAFLAPEMSRPIAPPLLEELEKVIGEERRVAVESRVKRLEEALRPTFQSLPKDPSGDLGADGVRYLLHRLFVDRHGWFVRGLEAQSGDPQNKSSPASVFKDKVSDGVPELFHERLESHGFSLHHVAVLAATLESFVHTETMERLHAAYRFSGLSQHEDASTEEQVAKAIETYMMLYIVGTDHTNASQRFVDAQMASIHDLYPTWPDTVWWARSVRNEVLGADDAPAATSFNTTARVVETIGDRYGRWQDKECQELKQSLLEMEDVGTGRVRLEAFYKSALEGNWQFSESVAFLRQMGALDESDPKKLSIIIPNYINSPSNCLASSKFYSVCCIDECESLLGHLETHIAAPDASAARIAELVASLASATVKAPRTLSAPLLQRLEEIAEEYGGLIPLHGRLFSQWMHHAYPRECQYPRMSGTTRPATQAGYEEWSRQTGEELTADPESMRWHVEEAKRGLQNLPKISSGPEETESGLLPWTADEELFVSRAVSPRASASTFAGWGRSLWAAGRGLALLGLMCSVSLMLVQMVRTSVVDPLKATNVQKYMV